MAWTALVVIALSSIGYGQTPIFSTRSDAVEVDVLVTDGGRVVRGLQASDFEVRENGQVQRIEVVTSDQLPLSVLLVVDVSDSLDTARRAALRRAGQQLLAQLTPIDQAGLVTFNERVTLRAPLTSDRARVEAALDVVRGEGRTSLVDATYAALLSAEGGTGRSLVIVFSDGVDSSSRLAPEAVLDIASRSDVVVYGVSVGRATGAGFFADLTSRTSGTLIAVTSNDDVAETFVKILDEFRQRYVLTYTPPEAAEGGWRTLDVRLKGRRGTVRARPGYFNEP